MLDEVIKIVLGCYGPQAGAVDQNLLDRVRSLPVAKNYINWEIPRPSIKELREQFGADVSDDELVLRVLCQDRKAMEAMNAAGGIKTYYPPPRTAMVEVIKELINQKKHAYIYMENEDFSVKLSKRST